MYLFNILYLIIPVYKVSPGIILLLVVSEDSPCGSSCILHLFDCELRLAPIDLWGPTVLGRCVLLQRQLALASARCCRALLAWDTFNFLGFFD